MIDLEKWEKLDDEKKLATCRALSEVANEKSDKQG